MGIDTLTADQRIEIQTDIVRRWWARRKRRRYQQTHIDPPHRTYDLAGREVRPDAPRISGRWNTRWRRR